jgi:hypothetical protein
MINFLTVLMNKFIFILLFLFFTTELNAQGWLTKENTLETNWNMTLQLGSNLLLDELKKDFSGTDNNMNNYPDWGINIQLSKMAWERIDLGCEIGNMSFNGINKNPSTINYLMLSDIFNNSDKHFLTYPVKYNSNIFNLALFTKYNFINFSSYLESFIKLNIFLRLGIGISYISSEMGYNEKVNYQLSGLRDPLFSTSRDLHFFDRIHLYICPAVGTNYQISERIFISAEMSFHFLNTGLVDGVYNLNNLLSPGINNSNIDEFKIPVYDFIGKFMIGFSYFFNLDTERRTRQKAYPWYVNRYRSYFSKYHTPASKRIIKERLPFYNNNFDE